MTDSLVKAMMTGCHKQNEKGICPQGSSSLLRERTFIRNFITCKMTGLFTFHKKQLRDNQTHQDKNNLVSRKCSRKLG